MKTYLPGEEEQELQRFKAAADRLVERARQDPEVAREFLVATGYFDVMAKATASESKIATQGKAATKSKASRARRKTVKAR